MSGRNISNHLSQKILQRSRPSRLNVQPCHGECSRATLAALGLCKPGPIDLSWSFPWLLVWGVFCQALAPRGLSAYFMLEVSLFDLAARFLAPTHDRVGAGARRSGQRMARSATEGSSLTASSTTAHFSVSGMTKFEGSCGLVHEASCHILVCGGPKTQTMMQGYASAASSETADPFLPTA